MTVWIFLFKTNQQTTVSLSQSPQARNPSTNAKRMNDNDVTKNFYRNKPASLIVELLFLLTYHSSPLVFSVYHEFLLTVESFLFLLALRGHLLHLLR